MVDLGYVPELWSDLAIRRPCGGIGRRGRLKICFSQGSGSSSLPGGTIFIELSR